MEFLGGDIVEVCSEEEGFLGSYHVATAVKKVEANSYAVQYENLVEEEDMSKTASPALKPLSVNGVTIS